MLNHLYIFLTILFTVYGQIVTKWQVNNAGAFPSDITEKFLFLGKLLLNPWVISGFTSVFLASLSWMAAMTKFPLSYAYPFMSLAFVLVLFLGAIFFQEALTLSKLISMGLIVAGIIIGSKA